MTSKIERGLCELYAEDPERADALVFGRVAHDDRRGFLKGAGLAAMGLAVGGAIPFHRNMPAGLIPAALAETKKDFRIEGASVIESTWPTLTPEMTTGARGLRPPVWSNDA